LAKAWDQIERIGRRSQAWQPRTLLVTGAGPIGLLAALMGTQRGLETHVLDHHAEGVKPTAVRGIGATYHTDINAALAGPGPDIIIECTAVPALIQALLGRTAPSGIMCLTGVSAPGDALGIDLGGLNRTIVLNNDVVFGTVNANRRHYELAAEALVRANAAWLAGLITRRVPLERWREALERKPDDIKVIIDFAAH
jgi:threonine dehydrogenase-like Zn-dependent dehydrogenase